MKVLVTGSQGQLGKSIERLRKGFPSLDFVFTTREELDITNPDMLSAAFSEHSPDYCINCAAYTAVDKAEEQPAQAFSINADAVGFLAKCCQEYNTTLIHLSTDFVFDGKSPRPYTEEDTPAPLSVYGRSKWEGERIIESTLHRYFIIRTSWVFSEYGRNFLKTMLKLSKERDELKVVDDQIGRPTYAVDLARYILELIESATPPMGLVHFANQGEYSWYGFAQEIFRIAGVFVKLHPIKSNDYPALAKRPAYSVLNTAKAEQILGTSIPRVENAIERCLQQLHV
jgi:dTDP-4-dehydrorhamnose reductase